MLRIGLIVLMLVLIILIIRIDTEGILSGAPVPAPDKWVPPTTRMPEATERVVIPETSTVISPVDPTNDDEFIKNLPHDNNCEDTYRDCELWAKNGECEVNPEYMLFQCPKSCYACKYTDDDKARLDKIYNSRMPDRCIYHAAEYPSEFSFLNKLYDYTLSVGY